MATVPFESSAAGIGCSVILFLGSMTIVEVSLSKVLREIAWHPIWRSSTGISASDSQRRLLFKCIVSSSSY